MRLDLHVHSTASDGHLDPADVVATAVAGRLDAIALTDHDTTSGVDDALRAAQAHPLEVIPAVEVSSTWENREIHVLGYFVDPGAPALIEHEVRAQRRRLDRLHEMVVRLRAQGVDLPFDEVLAVPGADKGNLGRPHLARALVADGHAATVDEAFERYIGNDCPAFVPTALGTPADAVTVVRQAGGLPVWAHPPRNCLADLMGTLVDAGLLGLEVYRPNHSASYIVDLEAVARDRGLLTTGGSDWHGPDDGTLGEFYVSGREVEDFLAAGGF